MAHMLSSEEASIDQEKLAEILSNNFDWLNMQTAAKFYEYLKLYPARMAIADRNRDELRARFEYYCNRGRILWLPCDDFKTIVDELKRQLFFEGQTRVIEWLSKSLVEGAENYGQIVLFDDAGIERIPEEKRTRLLEEYVRIEYAQA